MHRDGWMDGGVEGCESFSVKVEPPSSESPSRASSYSQPAAVQLGLRGGGGCSHKWWLSIFLFPPRSLPECDFQCQFPHHSLQTSNLKFHFEGVQDLGPGGGGFYISPSFPPANDANLPFNYAGISIMHARNNRAPPHPGKQRFFNSAPPIFMGNAKAIRFLAQKKVPFNYAPPGRRSDVPSIIQVQSYLWGLSFLGGLGGGLTLTKCRGSIPSSTSRPPPPPSQPLPGVQWLVLLHPLVENLFCDMRQP